MITGLFNVTRLYGRILKTAINFTVVWLIPKFLFHSPISLNFNKFNIVQQNLIDIQRNFQLTSLIQFTETILKIGNLFMRKGEAFCFQCLNDILYLFPNQCVFQRKGDTEKYFNNLNGKYRGFPYRCKHSRLVILARNFIEKLPA